MPVASTSVAAVANDAKKFTQTNETITYTEGEDTKNENKTEEGVSQENLV